MNIFSNKFINISTLIISLIFFLIINYLIFDFKKINSKKEVISETLINQENFIEEEFNSNWFIEIPSINLKAEIKDGVDLETLNLYVGHFKETAFTSGNIGLAGYNKKHEKNYFENLKLLKENDEIIYHYEDFSKNYVVNKISIIKNTDWSYLEQTEENKITLITGTENEPDYRLCVQAIEKQENY